MPKYLSLMPLMLLVACTPTGPPPIQTDSAAVASWSGDVLSISEIEERLPLQRTPACLEMRRSAGGGDIDRVLECYEEVARSLALERVVAAEFDDLEGAIDGLLEDEADRLRSVRMYLFQRRLNE